MSPLQLPVIYLTLPTMEPRHSLSKYLYYHTIYVVDSLAYAVPASECHRQMGVVTRYLQHLKQLTDTVPCSMCSHLHLQASTSVWSVQKLRAKQSLNGSVAGTAKEWSGQLLYVDTLHNGDCSGNVCPQCHSSLCADTGPDFALTTKWTMLPMPKELKSLSLLEHLLVTKRFYVVHCLTVLPVREGSLGYCLHVCPFPDREQYYYTNILPVTAEALHCLLKINFQHASSAHKGHVVLHCLTVQCQVVVTALWWLKANNVWYTDSVVDEGLLWLLPSDG